MTMSPEDARAARGWAGFLAAGIYAVEDRAPRWRRLALVPVNAVVIVAMLTERWWTA